MIHFDLDSEELDKIERLALAADTQTRLGKKDWPGKPSRQRLELFLATSPMNVMALVQMARRGLNAKETA